MIILGLHFGHDASISLIKDGEVVVCLEVERIKRIKHVIGIAFEDIETALKDADLKIEDIDYATLTSTQLVEYLFFNPEKLSINFEIQEAHKKIPCTLTDVLKIDHNEFEKNKIGWLKHVFSSVDKHPYHTAIPRGREIILDEKKLFGEFEKFVDTNLWHKVLKLDEIAKTDYSHFIKSDEVSYGFHYPVTLNLADKKIPAFVFSHHYAHIAYAFYQSPHQDAALLSNDGGGGGDLGYACGLFGYGDGNRLFPITPNSITAGEIYDWSAFFIGFDFGSGGAGKLMGLSAYGKPKFFDHKFVGNWHDCGKIAPKEWTDHCVKMATEMGYDLTALGDQKRILEPINVDIAASTQKLIEEIILKSTKALHSALRSSGVISKNLCLSGGIALNCPSNSRVINEGPFDDVFVPPAVGDMGLSIGSALALYYNLLGNERVVEKLSPKIAYLGLRSSFSDSEIKLSLEENSKNIEAIECDEESMPIMAAQDLNDDLVIALFDGRSEVGPRALGHRSILANPTKLENWKRVNLIKSRELWRPFAPMVLEGFEKEYFDSTQFPAYFMLLNAEVRSKKIPAVTHVDGSARVQSVNQDCGIIFEILKKFKEKSGIAVLMNTSFNGPGEPVIETANQAINFLLQTNLDCLYFSKYKITKKKNS